LSTIEGKNFVVTNLISEIADSYYELLSLDNQLEVIRENIKLQNQALDIVKVQKEAARTTELAVQKFQAEVLASQSMEFRNLTENQGNRKPYQLFAWALSAGNQTREKRLFDFVAQCGDFGNSIAIVGKPT